jgi:hypothetical protein
VVTPDGFTALVEALGAARDEQEPTMPDLICDFCGNATPVCYFPCKPFQIRADSSVEFAFPSGDRFYACPTCRPLVEERRWSELRAHCASADLSQAAAPQAPLALWAGFAANRQGPAVEFPPGTNPEADRR